MVKDKERYFKNNIDTSIGYQKSFLKKLGPYKLIIYLKADQNYIKYLNNRGINFLGLDGGQLDFETKLC